jgi:ABC-type lipoprotein export system ATPase subunit
VVTHDPRLERFADRVVRVEDGNIQSIAIPGAPPGASPATTSITPGPETGRTPS